jgi:hypothetical protein
MNSTLLIQIDNPKTLSFLYNLQELDLVKILENYSTPAKTKLSDKYKDVFTKEDSQSFEEHTKLMRGEWDNI